MSSIFGSTASLAGTGYEHVDELKNDLARVKSLTGYGLAALVVAVLGAGTWAGKLSNQVEQMDKHLASMDTRMERAAKDGADIQQINQRIDYLAEEVRRLRDGTSARGTR